MVSMPMHGQCNLRSPGHAEPLTSGCLRIPCTRLCCSPWPSMRAVPRNLCAAKQGAADASRPPARRKRRQKYCKLQTAMHAPMLRQGDQGSELGGSLVPSVRLRGWQAAPLKPYQVSPALRASPWPAVPPVPSHARRSSSRISGGKTWQRRAKSCQGLPNNAVRIERRPACQGT